MHDPILFSVSCSGPPCRCDQSVIRRRLVKKRSPAFACGAPSESIKAENYLPDVYFASIAVITSCVMSTCGAL